MTLGTAPVLAADLLLIAVVARAMGITARRLGQPAVIGEILGGILLGPTLLGHASTTLFPLYVRRPLADLADVGVCVLMFLVGLELDRGLLRGQLRIAASVSLSAFAVPFAFGVLLALYIAGRHPTPHHAAFVLFLGTAMSVTAFPVLARILTDRGLIRTPIGGLALACAAVGDVLAWTLLACAVALARAEGHPLRILLVVPYLAVMLGVIRPLAARYADRDGGSADRFSGVLVLSAVAVGLAASATATDRMGLHSVFGAFLFGAILPRHGAEWLRERALLRIETASATLLLPVFFVVAGLNVDLSKLGRADYGQLGLILLAAVGGKVAGAFGGARVMRVSPRHSAVLAVLLNTRGLTELVVLAVGVQAGVLDPRLNSLMVVMAVATTTMTGLLLRWVYPPDRMRLDADRSTLDAIHVSPEPKESRP